ncbi:unnamed protein product [Orchesella dallaii]|uniref:GB1/RHD3-type G domain-containing protein n=1 Tax=Orchesella dallaii TaxID=48710 RepID=A0ABP1QJ42_9HEXA
MTSVNEGDIAALLIKDVGLMSEWEFFYHYLRPQENRTLALKQIWAQSNFSSFNLIRAIINQWVSEKGSEATVNVLADILTTMNRIYIRDLLLQKFVSGSKVQSINCNLNDATNPTETEPTLTEEDELLQQKTSGGVTILRLLNSTHDGHGRILIFISHLLSMLSTVGDRPVAIISINGKQRSGKSFLANQFIKYLKHSEQGEAWLDERMESGFEWRDDYKRVTSGIQVWFEPLFVRVDGKEVGVIVMDTQGLHDENTGAQENSIIFGLSVLLSSVFIYNEMNTADDSLQFLRSYLEFAKFASAGGDDGAEGLVFQKLIFLRRDFQAVRHYAYGYYDDNSCPPNQTKNLKLTMFQHQQSPDMCNEAIETRLGIEKSFQEIGVYAMSSPGKKMPDMPEYQSSLAWDPEFRSCIMDFVALVFGHQSILNSTKKLFGHELTGEKLKEYVSTWAQLIQETEGMVESKTIFEITADMFYAKKIEETSNEYRTLMNRYLAENPTGVANTAFNTFHELALSSIESKFCQDRALGGESLLNKYKARLRERINGVKDDFVSINAANVVAEQERRQREAERIAAQQRQALMERQRLEAEVERQRREAELERQRVETEQENQRREAELFRQQQEARNLAISTAETRYQQTLQDLHISQGKLQQIQNNRNNYKAPVEMKKRNRVLGVVVEPTRWTEFRYDEGLYQQALQPAEAEVRSMQQRVNDAEHLLNVARNS